MSTIKVDKITKRTGSTLTFGEACTAVKVEGDDVRSNAYKASDAGNIISQSGTTITLGASGDTITIACGASQTGFGRSGTVDWQTSSIKTSTFTAESGKGYFVNTTSGGITVNLPAGVAGAIVGLKDYANIGGGNTVDPTLAAEGGSVLLVFVDSTQGWLPTQQSVTASPTGSSAFITATGGTITTSGDYKIHTFTGSGCFALTAGTSAPNNKVSYMVVAGGGGAPYQQGGGGGAGGFREGKCSSDPYADSPLDSGTAITVTSQTYPIAVGAGGAGEHQEIQILLHQEQYQLLVQLHQQVVAMGHLQDLIQVEHLVVQVAEQVKINLILELMVINPPYPLHKVILVVVEIQGQVVVVAAVELVLLVVVCQALQVEQVETV